MNKKLRKFFYYWLPFLIWAMVIFAFSSRPTKVVSQIHWKDFAVKKTAHFVEYFIFTALFYRASKFDIQDKKLRSFISAFFAIIYGVLDEIHQSFVPGREARARDVFFDFLGSIFFLFLIWRLLPKAPPKLKKLAEDLDLA
jgi:VanZ family protein